MKRRSRRIGLGVVAGALLAGLGVEVGAAPILCTDSQICRVSVVPKGVSALVGVSGNLWGIGKKGQAWNLGSGLEAQAAKPVKTGLKKDLTAGVALGAGLIAVGPKGALVRFDGTTWTADKSPVKVDLNAVWAASDQAAWAVGKKGTIVAWDGAKWAVQPSGTKVDLMGVWGSRVGDVWAVGGGGTILHHDGTAWSTVRTGNARLLAVSGLSDKLAWAVGELGSALRWNGSVWEIVKSGVATDLTVLHQWSVKEVMALDAEGGGARLDWMNELAPVSAGEAGFRSLTTVSGIAFALAQDGSLWRYAGGWTYTEEPKVIERFSSMALVGDVLAAGADDGVIGIRRNKKWERLVSGLPDINTLLGIGFDGKVITAVDHRGNVVRVDIAKKKPTVSKLPEAAGWNGMWMTTGFGVAVGSNDIAMFDGKSWRLAELPTKSIEFEAASGVAKDALWVAGDSGTILFWDGKSWTPQTTNTSENLEAIWMADRKFGVAVGRSGTVLFWDGNAWSRVEVPTRGMLRSVCGRSPVDITVGGNSGEILTYDGQRWTIEASPLGMAFRACAVMPDGEILMGGQNGGYVTRPARERAR